VCTAASTVAASNIIAMLALFDYFGRAILSIHNSKTD